MGLINQPLVEEEPHRLERAGDLASIGVTSIGIGLRSDGVVIISSGPTAVSVSGRVVTPDGRGMKKVWVSFVNRAENLRRTLTSMLGYYRFDMVAAGHVAVLTVTSKGYGFAPRTLILKGNLNEVDLKAEYRELSVLLVVSINAKITGKVSLKKSGIAGAAKSRQRLRIGRVSPLCLCERFSLERMGTISNLLARLSKID